MLTDILTAPLILVVEDDANHAELIQRSFEEAPAAYRLEIVGTIRDARMAIGRYSPSLILTDYRLPDGDGSELVVMAAAEWPVIIMTSHGSEQVAVEAMKIGAQDYIVKSPEAFEALPRTVSFALRTWSLILARRHADDALAKAEKRYRALFTRAGDGIFIMSTDCILIEVNEAFARMHGYSPLEMQRMNLQDLDTPETSHCAPERIRRLLAGETLAFEVEHYHKDGRIFPLEVSASLITFGDESFIQCFHRDITERKRAEDQRLHLEQQFHHAQKLESLGVMAGGIAHDFNNILTVILGHCYMAREDLITEHEYKAAFQKVESASNRAADLCRQMLTYAGKSPLVQTRVNLLSLVDEVAKMLHAAIKKNISITLDLKQDVPQIKGDSGQIQQIIMNLIINAAEAIGDANGTIKILLTEAAFKADQAEVDTFGTFIKVGRYACLEVTDTGIGMDEETQKRIFEPFYSTKFTGRGLGMSAIQGIIKSHEGLLLLTTSPGVGTTFKVLFPLSETFDGFVTAPATLIPFKKSGGTILLVDDEQALRNVGAALLNSMGFRALTAQDGREALEIFFERGREIDVVMLDLLMPLMGGIDTYHELRKTDTNIPILICSGYELESVAHVINNDQYAGFVPKPYKPDELQNVIVKMMGYALPRSLENCRPR
ncbi:MAG: response regulator [Desulfuromonadaceae bacterium]|nr:response regulator [Desulfuromonadaceae bacterium]